MRNVDESGQNANREAAQYIGQFLRVVVISREDGVLLEFDDLTFGQKVGQKLLADPNTNIDDKIALKEAIDSSEGLHAAMNRLGISISYHEVEEAKRAVTEANRGRYGGI